MNNLDDIIIYLQQSGQHEMATQLKAWVSRYTRMKGLNDGLMAALDKPTTVNLYLNGDKVETDGK